MKHFLILLCLMVFTSCAAQQVTITSNYSNSLNLEKALDLFCKANSTEEFEKLINDQSNEVTNLDLNYDGYVDYLRCVDVKKNDTVYVIIQACIDLSSYYDVASICIEKKNDTYTTYIAGNEIIYGSNCIVYPTVIAYYPIYNWYWHHNWYAWHSPYYWGRYPYYYRPYRPYHGVVPPPLPPSYNNRHTVRVANPGSNNRHVTRTADPGNNKSVRTSNTNTRRVSYDSKHTTRTSNNSTTRSGNKSSGARGGTSTVNTRTSNKQTVVSNGSRNSNSSNGNRTGSSNGKRTSNSKINGNNNNHPSQPTGSRNSNVKSKTSGRK